MGVYDPVSTIPVGGPLLDTLMNAFSTQFGKKYQQEGEDRFRKQQEKEKAMKDRDKIQKRITEIQRLLASDTIPYEQKGELMQELSELQAELGTIQNPYGQDQMRAG